MGRLEDQITWVLDSVDDGFNTLYVVGAWICMVALLPIWLLFWVLGWLGRKSDIVAILLLATLTSCAWMSRVGDAVCADVDEFRTEIQKVGADGAVLLGPISTGVAGALSLVLKFSCTVFVATMKAPEFTTNNVLETLGIRESPDSSKEQADGLDRGDVRAADSGSSEPRDG